MSKQLIPEELVTLRGFIADETEARAQAHKHAPTNYMSFMWRQAEIAENRRNLQAGRTLEKLLDHIETLNAVIAARDQWADQVTEQYSAREMEVKRALQGLRAFARQTKCLRESNIEITAIQLNITLD
jgi:hypothetical protein